MTVALIWFLAAWVGAAAVLGLLLARTIRRTQTSGDSRTAATRDVPQQDGPPAEEHAPR